MFDPLKTSTPQDLENIRVNFHVTRLMRKVYPDLGIKEVVLADVTDTTFTDTMLTESEIGEQDRMKLLECNYITDDNQITDQGVAASHYFTEFMIDSEGHSKEMLAAFRKAGISEQVMHHMMEIAKDAGMLPQDQGPKKELSGRKKLEALICDAVSLDDWNLLQERRYRVPKGYSDPYAANLEIALWMTADRSADNSHDILWLWGLARHFLMNYMPVYWWTEDRLGLFLESPALEDIRKETSIDAEFGGMMPFKSALMMLPSGLMVDSKNRDIEYLLIDFKDNENPDNTAHRLTVTAKICDAGHYVCVFEGDSKIQGFPIRDYPDHALPLETADAEDAEEIFLCALAMIDLMTHFPEGTDEGHQLKEAKTRDPVTREKRRTKVFQPNFVLDRDDGPKVYSDNDNSAGGRSVATHFRRGYYRSQHHGKDRALRKTIFIPHTIVNDPEKRD